MTPVHHNPASMSAHRATHRYTTPTVREFVPTGPHSRPVAPDDSSTEPLQDDHTRQRERVRLSLLASPRPDSTRRRCD
jgi:hypothetical protein